MKFLLIDNAEFSLGSSATKLKDSLTLINIDHVSSIIFSKDTKKGMIKLHNDRTFYLSGDEMVDFMKLINDPKIIRPQSLDKIYREIQKENKNYAR